LVEVYAIEQNMSLEQFKEGTYFTWIRIAVTFLPNGQRKNGPIVRAGIDFSSCAAATVNPGRRLDSMYHCPFLGKIIMAPLITSNPGKNTAPPAPTPCPPVKTLPKCNKAECVESSFYPCKHWAISTFFSHFFQLLLPQFQ
jgi:hypothetical protein